MQHKAEGLPLTMIVIGIIVLVTALLVIFGFKTYWGKGLTDIDRNQQAARDSDGDSFIDLVDVCPCEFGSFDGCKKEPSTTDPKELDTKRKDTSCIQAKK